MIRENRLLRAEVQTIRKAVTTPPKRKSSLGRIVTALVAIPILIVLLFIILMGLGDLARWGI